MKNKSLVTLILVSIVTFAALVFSLYKFVLKEKTIFYTDGYISITDKDVPSKAYFVKGTEYKNGYSDDIIFTDKENEKIVASKYSFAFYNDKSINFMTDGVLMPLDDLNEKYLSYYNIKRNYIIEYNDNKYLISSKDKDISFDSFIGRISDTKYIVAGKNLKLKLSSSDKFIENYYFELEFVDGSLVKINNNDLSIETISSECYILVGDDVKIDLNKKEILYKNETKAKLEEIVINSNQNIDISYEDNKTNDGKGDDNTTNNNTTKPDKNPIKVEDRYEVETVVDYKKAPYVELITSSVNSHKIALNFNVIDENSLITSNVKAKLLNVKTNEVIDLKEYSNYIQTNEYSFDNLASNTKYIITIYATYKGNSGVVSDYVMFQRVFNTSMIGSSLELDYRSSNELSYNINIDKTATFTSATLKLYDENGNLVESFTFKNEGKNINHVFKNLKSNSKYTAKIENVSYGAVSYPDGSASTVSTSTLKYNPFKDSTILPSSEVTVSKKDYAMKFNLQNVSDPNKAIKKVVYNIYDSETGALVKTITKDSLGETEVKFEEPLDKSKTYYYNAVITLDDNEKTLEYQTENSVEFSMGRKISPSISAKNLVVTATTVNGTLIIYDPDNTIDVNKRVYVEYKSETTGETTIVDLEYTSCGEDESLTTKCAHVNIDKLTSSTNYTIDLYGFVDLNDESKPADNMFIDRIQVYTSIANKINTNMKSIVLTDEEAFQDIFRLNINFSLPETTPERIKENLTSFDIELCEGTKSDNTVITTLHVTENIIADYFDGTKTLTLADFGYTLDKLMERHPDGLISKNYVIYVKNGVSGTDYIEFDPMSLAFEINDSLLGLISGEATIDVTIIPNEKAKNVDSNLKPDTAVGLKLEPALVESASTSYIRKYIKKINYVIYDVTFTDKDSVTNPLKITDDLDLTESTTLPSKEIYFKDYEYLKRGHVYIITYTLSLQFTDDGVYLEYPFSENSSKIAKPVESNRVSIEKEVPTVYLFPWTSDEGSITYKYEIIDKDKALAPIDSNFDTALYYDTNDSGNTLSSENVSCEKGNFKKSKFTCSKFLLNKDDLYNIYLNVRLIESGANSYAKIMTKTFEGITDLTNINYEILKENNLLKYNNLLVLKLNGDLEKLNRISSYTLTISSNNKSFKIENINYKDGFIEMIGGNVITYTDGTNTKTWSFNNKSDNNLTHTAYIADCEDENLCLYLDYSKLYNSDNFGSYFETLRDSEISVTLEGLYDSGKIGLMGNTNKYYVVRTFDEDKKYLILFNKLNKSDSALGAYYPFLGDSNSGYKGYFVDDDETNNQAFYENNYLTGYIYLKNAASKEYKDGKNTLNVIGNLYGYKINEYGATIDNTSIVTSELNTNSIYSDDNKFTYSNVIPSISMLALNPTINGAKLYMSLSGLKESDITKEDGISYLYLEVGDANNSKVIKINKDELTSQSGVINDGKYKINIPSDGNYYVAITKVSVDNANVEDYSYDYLTSEINFNTNDYDGKNITVSYRIVIYGLNVGSEYSLKAYMKVNGKKVYLSDATSQNYEEYLGTFTTLKSSEVGVLNPSFSVKSIDDYSKRNLLLDYKVNELIGIKNISYDICTNGECQEKIETCDGTYYDILGSSVCVKDKNYNITSSYDITGDDFVFNKKYNVVINAVIDTFDGERVYQIYADDLLVGALNEPKLEVIKSSHYNLDDGFNLNFKVLFNDPDKVIVNGEYVAYLARLSSDMKSYEPVAGTQQTHNIYSADDPNINKIKYSNLAGNTEYYFIVEYVTYINNEGSTARNEKFERFLVYTLNDYHISIGKVQYIAENYIDEAKNVLGKTTLRFGYAANIMKDVINGETPEDYIEQEAYVAGIAYTIVPENGGNYLISGTKFFVDESENEEDKITYRTGSSSDSEVGDSYYQMILRHSPYLYNDDLSIKNAGYTITFMFYLGGPISDSLDTQEKCEANISNHWDEENNKCYVLGGKQFTRTGVTS